jgi:glucose/arabinose dehydrogenase
LVFSKDGKSLFLAVGSASNVDDRDKSKAEFHRAIILEYTPEGKFASVYTSGIRNPGGLGIHPETGEVWTSINERDNLQAHNASLGLTFHEGTQFPEQYRGDLFAAEHGSWNRSVRAGQEVIRVPLEKGRAGGVYQDFLTGFVTEEGRSRGRPAGVAIANAWFDARDRRRVEIDLARELRREVSQNSDSQNNSRIDRRPCANPY